MAPPDATPTSLDGDAPAAHITSCTADPNDAKLAGVAEYPAPFNPPACCPFLPACLLSLDRGSCQIHIACQVWMCAGLRPTLSLTECQHTCPIHECTLTYPCPSAVISTLPHSSSRSRSRSPRGDAKGSGSSSGRYTVKPPSSTPTRAGVAWPAPASATATCTSSDFCRADLSWLTSLPDHTPLPLHSAVNIIVLPTPTAALRRSQRLAVQRRQLLPPHLSLQQLQQTGLVSMRQLVVVQ